MFNNVAMQANLWSLYNTIVEQQPGSQASLKEGPIPRKRKHDILQVLQLEARLAKS